jgi:hypothetical protein
MPPTCCRSTKWRATAIRSCPPPNRPGCRQGRRRAGARRPAAADQRPGHAEPHAQRAERRRQLRLVHQQAPQLHDRGSQTLFNWTQINNLRSQRELSKAADFTLDSANDSLIVRTSAAYFNVLVAIESLNAAQTNEAAAKKQFDFADKRLEVGLAPITDVHEARAQYDQARANTIVAQNTLADNYQALTELTGQPVVNLRGLPADFRRKCRPTVATSMSWCTRPPPESGAEGAGTEGQRRRGRRAGRPWWPLPDPVAGRQLGQERDLG